MSGPVDPFVPGPTPVASGEFGVIGWIRARAEAVSTTSKSVAFGIGDDCAGLYFTPRREVLVTTDMLLDGRHFLTQLHTPWQIGQKAMRVNLSDVAAMAGVPVAAVVAVALPRNYRDGSVIELAQELSRGLEDAARSYGVVLVGGDTNAWDGPLAINITLLGEATALGPVRRGGAKPGDVIFVTGPLGGSLCLGRHLNPVPRIEEALKIHERVPLHAMIDISDGLAADLGHILEESGLPGAHLHALAIPIHDDAQIMARTSGRTPLDHALNDGEDFELCFTVSPQSAQRLLSDPPEGVELFQIGTVSGQPGLWLAYPDGNTERVEPQGFDHLRASTPGEA